MACLISFPCYLNMDGAPDLIDLCQSWHSGQTSGMYSVLSTYSIHNAEILQDLACELREAREIIGDDDPALDSDRETLDYWVNWTAVQVALLPDADD